MKTLSDFLRLCCEQIDLPEPDVCRCLVLHLQQSGITEQDIVLYINYPEYTEAELAGVFGLRQSTVSRALARVRAAWPTLLTDPEVTRHSRVDHLPHMVPYAPWMDDEIKVRF